MRKKESLWLFGSLAAAISILYLAAILLQPVRYERILKEEQQVMQQLLPGSEVFTAEKYDGEDSNIAAVFRGETGYVIETAVDGYVDQITVWVGVDSEGTVTGVTIRDMEETRGLGRNTMTDLSYLSQYLHGTGDAVVGETIDAVTGATVSSKAVTKAINSAVGYVTGADVISSATEWGE